MCSPEVRKEANRLNWMVKGQNLTLQLNTFMIVILKDYGIITKDPNMQPKALMKHMNIVYKNSLQKK